MRWDQGRAAVDAALSRGELQRVPASRDHADLLLSRARQHVESTTAIVQTAG